MSIRKTMICVVVAVLVAVAVTNATPPSIPWPMDTDLKILRLPDNAGHGELTLTFKPSRYYENRCSEVEVEVETRHGLTFLGAPKWTVPMDSSTVYTTVLNFDIPDNDTCGVRVHFVCDGIRSREAIYFVTTGDTVETYAGHPRGRTPRPDSTWAQIEQARFTPEALQREFEFFLDLRGCYEDCQAFVDSAIGTLAPTDSANVFRIRTTIYNYLSLSCDWVLRIEPVDRETQKAIRSSISAPPRQ